MSCLAIIAILASCFIFGIVPTAAVLIIGLVLLALFSS